MRLTGCLSLALLACAAGCQGAGSTAPSKTAGASTAPAGSPGPATTTPVTSTSVTAPVTTGATTAGPGGAGALTGAAGITYYVSPSGVDTNPGTPASPFREIRQALTVVAPGDLVLVADGSYKGFDVNAVNGTAGRPITIQAQGKAALVLATTDRSDNRDNIFITYSSYVIVDGFTSSNGPRSGMRIDNSNNVTARNGTFGTNATWGIFTDFSNDTLLENNECFASGTQHGIYVSNSSARPIVRGNRLHDNAGCGLHMNGDLSQGGVGLIVGALVENNVIWNNGTAGGSGINMDGVQGSTIVNNLLYGNHASGISAYQTDGAAGPSGDLIAHNTIDQAPDGRAAMNISSTAGPLTLRNNVFFQEKTGGYAVSFAAQADVTNTDSDYNILGGAAELTADGGNTLVALAQWQTQGLEVHSFTATLAALFVAPGSDYHLAPGSPAVDTGLTLASVTVDLEGNPRPHGAASDVGCYEQQ
jgi:parallel beta-helix repeat protein